MKILVIGGRGTIGRKVVERLSGKHEVHIAGRAGDEITVDIADPASIEKMFLSSPVFDAVVCTAGEAKWAPFDQMSQEDFYVGIRSKLMGQVNLIRIGRKHVSNGASFTLSTGILADDPVRQTTSAAMVNGAIHSFVKAVALETDRGMRVNAVCSGLVEDSAEKYADYFPGHNPVPMHKVVNAYIKSIEGSIHGKIIRVYE